MPWLRRTGRIAIACVLGIVSGCDSGADVSPTFTVRDSAGVRIVVSDRPIWSGDAAWKLSIEPDVEVGVFEGDDQYQLDRVMGVTRLSDGRIVVLNGGDSQLRFYDDSGEFLKAVAGAGDGPGELNRPTGLIRQAGDTLLVAMRAGWESSWFTGQGEFVTRGLLDVARRGEVLDSLWGCPIRPGLLPDGTLVLCFGSGPDRDQQGFFSGASHWLVRMPYDVSWIDTVGAGNYPDAPFGIAGMTAVTAGGDPQDVFVGDAGSFEIGVIRDRQGRVGSIRYPEGLREAGPSDHRAYDSLLNEFPPALRSRYLGSGSRPSRMPGFRNLHYDPEGYLWVVQYRAPWEVERHSALVFRVDGPLMGTVELPLGFEITEIGPDYVLGIWRDDLEVEYVRLYGLERS